MKTLLKISRIFFHLVIFILAGFLMVCFAYYFTRTLLVGQFNWGNDIGFSISLIDYLKRYYPPIPKWNYAWGGGMPFLDIYSFLPTLVTFFGERLTHYSAIQLIRLFSWVSVPATAAGIAVLGKLTTKSWLIGILAGVMMFFSPDSWLWITQGGFYSYAFSVPFFAWSLVFFVLALRVKKRAFWLLPILFYGLTWLAHPMSGTILTLVIPFLGVGFSWQEEKGWRRLIKGLALSFLVILVGALLVSWWIFPFYFSRTQAIFFGPEQIPAMTFREMVGLDVARDVVYVTSTFFTASVAIMFFLGCLMALLRRSYMRSLAVVCLVAILIVVAPKYSLWLMKNFLTFWQSTNVRATLILKVMGPIVAAYGGASLIRPLFWLGERLVSKLKENFFWKQANSFAGGVVAVGLFAYLVTTVVVKPPYGEGFGGYYLGYGPLYTWTIPKVINGKLTDDLRGIDFFPDFRAVPKTILTKGITVDEVERHPKRVEAAANALGVNDHDRVDIPSAAGGISMTFTSATTASIVSPYIGTSLMPRMIGWQSACFYEEGFCTVAELEDIARWFGISQVWLGGGEDYRRGTIKMMSLIEQSEHFQLEKTEYELGGKNYFWNREVFTDSSGLASITNKPVILVIGDNPPNNDVYDTVFKTLGRAGFGYEDAWSVKGARFIDDYQLEELAQFEIIFLHAYQYHNYNRAWGLIEDYLDQGGAVLVDNGWQYQSPEWGSLTKEGEYVQLLMPAIFPVTKTVWTSLGPTWSLKLGDQAITKGVGTEDWGKPLWGELGWGAAVSQPEWLAQGAIPLLFDQKGILAASREVGRGKIVWLGFDFFGHLAAYRAGDEAAFFGKVVSYLAGGVQGWEEKLDFSRPNPDAVTIPFALQGVRNKLMFKELASANWQVAQIGQQKLPVYSAGPGWRLVFLPEGAARGEVVFRYRKAWYEWLGISLAVVSGIGLMVYMVWGKKRLLKIAEKGLASLSLLPKAKIGTLKKKWESEDY